MSDQETWAAYLTVAQNLRAQQGTPDATNQIPGRFVTVLVDRLTQFWERHKDTLVPFLTDLAIAALEALVAQRASIHTVNPPGPQ